MRVAMLIIGLQLRPMKKLCRMTGVAPWLKDAPTMFPLPGFNARTDRRR